MAYRNFTLEKLQREFGVTNEVVVSPLFGAVDPISPSEYLLRDMQLARQFPMRTEKARSELVVVPILKELMVRNGDFFTYYSGEYLTADADRGLVGEIDFMIAKRTRTYNISFPIFSVVEAKKRDFDLGVPQCAAQMIGAQQINALYGHALPLYGCVTTATEWLFMHLDGQHLRIEAEPYRLDNLPQLLGVFQHILDDYKELLTGQGFGVAEPALPYGALWV